MSGYIKELRKTVGHKTLIQCAASIICVDENGNILLGRRCDNHLLGYSGGSVEIDERVEDCAKRELFEEMGLKAEDLEFFYVNSGPETHYVYPNGDEVSNIEIIYICRNWSGTLKSNDGEMLDLKFYDPSLLDLNDISDPIRPVVAQYISRFKLNK